jgi:hypothetical protein
MEESTNPLNVPMFFHTILFAYQKKLRDLLGTGEAIFVHPVLDTINSIDKMNNLHFIRGKNLDEILENYSKDVMASQVVQEAFFEKLGEEHYVFHIEGCSFANPTHDLLKPKDVICPLTLIAMSIFQSATGKKIQITDSNFTTNGCTTHIC